jgi:hypothetical protein
MSRIRRHRLGPQLSLALSLLTACGDVDPTGKTREAAMNPAAAGADAAMPGDVIVAPGPDDKEVPDAGPDPCGEHALQTRVRFADAHVPHGSTCRPEVQTRSCVDGSWGPWSGSHVKPSCVVDEPRACDGAAHGHTESRVRYASREVPFGSECMGELQTRSCDDGSFGTWSGTFTEETCSAQAEPGCDGSPGGGQATRVRYLAAVEPFGAACRAEIQTRTCHAGAWSDWSGSFGEPDCRVTDAAECEGTPHGGAESRVRYERREVPAGDGCVYEVQTRSCHDGAFTDWEGSFAEVTCRVLNAEPTCPAGFDTCGVCGGPGTERWYVDQDGDGYGDPALARDLCPADDHAGLVRDSSDVRPECFTLRGDRRIERHTDVAALGAVCELDGHLSVAGDATLQTVELPRLRYLGGVLRVAPCTDLSCSHNDELAAVRLPALETLHSLLVGGNPKLGELVLSALGSVPGSLQLGYCEDGLCFGNPVLDWASFDALHDVAGPLGLTLVKGAAAVRFPQLTSVGALVHYYSAPRTPLAEMFPALEIIEGELGILSSTARSIELPRLLRVGSMRVQGVAELTSLRMPALRDLGGFTMIGQALTRLDCAQAFPALRDAHFDALTLLDNQSLLALSCDGIAAIDELWLSSNEWIEEVRLRGLETLGKVTMLGNYNIRVLELPMLRSVSGNFWMASTKLAGLRLPSLTEVHGDLELAELREPGPLSLPALERVGGALKLRSINTTHVELPALAGVGAVSFAGFGEGAVIALDGLRRCEGKFETRYTDMAELRLPLLEHVGGSLEFYSDRGLQTLSLPSLTRVEDDLYVGSMYSMERIEAPVLGSVRSLMLYGNARLPACAASQLAARLAVTCNCSDNRGSGTCGTP